MASKIIKGITIEIGGETTKLDKALKEATGKSQLLSGELREVNKLLKLDPKNTELLAQKQKILAESVSETKGKLDILKTAEQQVQAQFKKGEASEEQYRAIQREIVSTEQQLKSLEKQAKESNSTLAAVGDVAGNIGEKSEAAGKSLMPVTAGIGALGAAAVASYNTLDDGYDTIIKKTGATEQQLDSLKKTMKNVFSDLPTDAETAGIAVGEVNTRFQVADERLETLSKQFIEFAEINNTDVNTSIDGVDTIMEKFNVDSSKAEGVLGLFTKAGQNTGITMDSMQNIMSANGATLKEMNLDIVSSVNLLAQMEARGVDNNAAMAGLKKAQQNATAEGKTLKDTLGETIENIKKAATETDALQIATDLFGKKGAAEMTQAIREGKFSVDDLSGSLDDYKNIVEDTFSATLDPPDKAKVALNNLKLAGADLGNSVMTTVEPVVQKAIDKAKEFTQWFNNLSNGQKEMIVKIAMVIAVIAPALLIFGKLASGVSAICGAVSKASGLFKGLSGVVGAITSPIGITVAAIAAVVAIIVVLYNKCEWFRDAVNAIFEYIKNFIGGAIETVGGFISSVWDMIQAVWGFVQPYLEAAVQFIGGIMADVVQIFNDAWEIIKAVWDFVKPYFELLWENIATIFSVVKNVLGGFFKAAWESIKAIWNVAAGYFSAVWNSIKAVFSAVSGILGGFFRSAWQVIKAVWDVVAGYFSAVWNAIKGVFSVVKDVLTGNFKGAWEGIKSIFSGFADFFKTAWESVKKIFGAVRDFFKGAFGNAWEAVKSVFSSWGTFFGGLWGRITNTFSRIGTNIADAIGNAVKSGINGIITMIENTINFAIGLINGAIGLINLIPGVEIGTINDVYLPRLAKGGILQNGRAIVAEAGPEIIEMVNGKTIVTPLSDSAKNTAIERKFGQQGGKLAEITMKIENFYNNRQQDVRELTEEVMKVAAEILERDDRVYE